MQKEARMEKTEEDWDGTDRIVTSPYNDSNISGSQE